MPASHWAAGITPWTTSRETSARSSRRSSGHDKAASSSLSTPSVPTRDPSQPPLPWHRSDTAVLSSTSVTAPATATATATTMASTAPADAAAPVAGGGGTCTSKPSPPSGSSSRRVSLFHPRDLGPAGGAASTGSLPRAAGSSWSSALFHPLAGPYAHAAAFSTAAAAGSTSARAGPSAGAGAGAERQQELESFDHPDLPDVGERPNFFESLKRKLYGTSGWELPGLGHDTDPATDAAAKEVLDAAVGVAGALGATPFSAVTRTIMTATTPPPLSVSTRGRHVHDRLPSPDRRPLSPARARPASRSPMASPRHDAPRRHSLYTSSPMAFPVRGRGVDPRDMDLESVGSEPGSARAGFALHLELPSTIRPSSLFSLGPRSASTTDRGGVGGGVGYGHRSGHDHGVQSAGGGSGAAVSDPVPIPASLTLPTHNGSPTASSLTVNSDTSSSHVHDNNYDPVQHSQALGIDVGALESIAEHARDADGSHHHRAHGHASSAAKRLSTTTSRTLSLFNKLRSFGGVASSSSASSSQVSRSYWMQDDKVSECYDCKRPFTTFRRKHHCRICGQIFCGSCASSFIQNTTAGSAEAALRVCNFCFKVSSQNRDHSALLHHGKQRYTEPIQDAPQYDTAPSEAPAPFSAGMTDRSRQPSPSMRGTPSPVHATDSLNDSFEETPLVQPVARRLSRTIHSDIFRFFTSSHSPLSPSQSPDGTAPTQRLAGPTEPPPRTSDLAGTSTSTGSGTNAGTSGELPVPFLAGASTDDLATGASSDVMPSIPTTAAMDPFRPQDAMLLADPMSDHPHLLDPEIAAFVAQNDEGDPTPGYDPGPVLVPDPVTVRDDITEASFDRETPVMPPSVSRDTAAAAAAAAAAAGGQPVGSGSAVAIGTSAAPASASAADLSADAIPLVSQIPGIQPPYRTENTWITGPAVLHFLTASLPPIQRENTSMTEGINAMNAAVAKVPRNAMKRATGASTRIPRNRGRQAFTGYARPSKYSARAVSRHYTQTGATPGSASALPSAVTPGGPSAVVGTAAAATATDVATTTTTAAVSGFLDVPLPSASAELAPSLLTVIETEQALISMSDAFARLPDECMTHLRRMLRQVLTLAKLKPVAWEEVLVVLLLTLARHFRSGDVRVESMFPRNFVKIKKVPGGVPSDSRVIWGVIVSQNVAHKAMLRTLLKPRILLLTFGLEYSRVNNRFQSLNAVISQEEEHLQNLVSRIVALKPHVVLVGRTVSRLALEMLHEQGVIVCKNVKSSVLETVAYHTGAEILPSMDRLSRNPRLGYCQEFSVKTFCHPSFTSGRKTFLYFDGCDPQMGCTIVLRGNEPPLLRNLKEILNLMVLVVNNMRLESAMLRDQHCVTRRPLLPTQSTIVVPSQPSDLFLSNPALHNFGHRTRSQDVSLTYIHTDEEDDVADVEAAVRNMTRVIRQLRRTLQRYHVLIRRFEARLLSSSPNIHFPAPYTLLKAKSEMEIKLVCEQKRLERYVAKHGEDASQFLPPHWEMTVDADTVVSPIEGVTHGTSTVYSLGGHGGGGDAAGSAGKMDEADPLLGDHDLSVFWPTMLQLDHFKPNTLSGSLHIDASALHASDEDRELLLSRSSRVGLQTMLSDEREPAPQDRQQIAVLFTNICISKHIPCSLPELQTIEYYRDSDLPLGQYLEDMCRQADSLCDNKICGNLPMIKHLRSYTHANGRVNVVMEEFNDPGRGFQHQIVMWSFCKKCKELTGLRPMSKDAWNYSFGKYLELSYYHHNLIARDMPCDHDLQQDHIRYFRIENLVVRFEYEPIELLELAVPPMVIRPRFERHQLIKQNEEQHLRELINRIYDSVDDRLATLHDILSDYGATLQDSNSASAEESTTSAQTLLNDMDKKYAALDVLKQRSHGDRRHLQNNLTTLVEHTLSTDFLSLNNMIQALVLRTSEWDTSLDGFIRTFMGNIGSEDMAAYLRRLTHMPGFRKIFPPESFGMAGSVKGPDGTRSKSSISKPSFTTLRPLDVLRVGVGSRAGEDDTESPESHGLAINPSGLPDGPVAANETIDEMLETGAMGLGHGPGNKHVEDDLYLGSTIDFYHQHVPHGPVAPIAVPASPTMVLPRLGQSPRLRNSRREPVSTVRGDADVDADADADADVEGDIDPKAAILDMADDATDREGARTPAIRVDVSPHFVTTPLIAGRQRSHRCGDADAAESASASLPPLVPVPGAAELARSPNLLPARSPSDGMPGIALPYLAPQTPRSPRDHSVQAATPRPFSGVSPATDTSPAMVAMAATATTATMTVGIITSAPAPALTPGAASQPGMAMGYQTPPIQASLSADRLAHSAAASASASTAASTSASASTPADLVVMTPHEHRAEVGGSPPDLPADASSPHEGRRWETRRDATSTPVLPSPPPALQSHASFLAHPPTEASSVILPEPGRVALSPAIRPASNVHVKTAVRSALRAGDDRSSMETVDVTETNPLQWGVQQVLSRGMDALNQANPHAYLSDPNNQAKLAWQQQQLNYVSLQSVATASTVRSPDTELSSVLDNTPLAEARSYSLTLNTGTGTPPARAGATTPNPFHTPSAAAAAAGAGATHPPLTAPMSPSAPHPPARGGSPGNAMNTAAMAETKVGPQTHEPGTVGDTASGSPTPPSRSIKIPTPAPAPTPVSVPSATPVPSGPSALSMLGTGASLTNAFLAPDRPGSIVRTLANLWTGTALSLEPVLSALAPTEHILPDSDIIIREDEPTSVVAYTLVSAQYRNKLKQDRDAPQEKRRAAPESPATGPPPAANGTASGHDGPAYPAEGVRGREPVPPTHAPSLPGPIKSGSPATALVTAPVSALGDHEETQYTVSSSASMKPPRPESITTLDTPITPRPFPGLHDERTSDDTTMTPAGIAGARHLPHPHPHPHPSPPLISAEMHLGGVATGPHPGHSSGSRRRGPAGQGSASNEPPTASSSSPKQDHGMGPVDRRTVGSTVPVLAMPPPSAAGPASAIGRPSTQPTVATSAVAATTPAATSTPPPPPKRPTDIEDTLLRASGTQIRCVIPMGPVRATCRVFFAEQFDALRRNCHVDAFYIPSLSRCVHWDASGGKSGSSFMKTLDERLIVKQLSKPEFDSLVRFAPAYFEYMSHALFHALPTVLAKIFGFYQVAFKNQQTGKSTKLDFLVMENLWYDRKISRIFDLKGSIRNRHVRSTGKENEVLLDENLVELIYESPLFIREHSKKLLRGSVWNDTLFLSKLNVMDYSLVVGIDEEHNELVVGIVDFIRTFTWDKKVENWVKETAFLGGGGAPTVVSPRQYKTRFREAMDRYFLMVPDIFHSGKQDSS